MVAKPLDLVAALIKKGGRNVGGRTSRVAMFIIVDIESEADIGKKRKKQLEKPCQAPSPEKNSPSFDFQYIPPPPPSD